MRGYKNHILLHLNNAVSSTSLPSKGGGAVAQSVERATPVQESQVRSPLWPPAPYWLGWYQFNVTS